MGEKAGGVKYSFNNVPPGITVAPLNYFVSTPRPRFRKFVIRSKLRRITSSRDDVGDTSYHRCIPLSIHEDEEKACRMSHLCSSFSRGFIEPRAMYQRDSTMEKDVKPEERENCILRLFRSYTCIAQVLPESARDDGRADGRMSIRRAKLTIPSRLATKVRKLQGVEDGVGIENRQIGHTS